MPTVRPLVSHVDTFVHENHLTFNDNGWIGFAVDFYTPLFSKVVDSSLWSEPDYVIKIFLTMLAKKDRDQVCRGTAYNIAQWSRKTEAEVLEAFRILAAPDTKRLEPQPHEGRRIEKVEDGWLMLNGKYYQDLMGTINRRAKKATYEKNRRERMAGRIPASQDKPSSGAYRAKEALEVKKFENGEPSECD